MRTTPKQAMKMLNDLRLAEASCIGRRRFLQAEVVRHLIEKHGGVRAAARAIGVSPGNFANMKSLKVQASCELLLRIAAP